MLVRCTSLDSTQPRVMHSLSINTWKTVTHESAVVKGSMSSSQLPVSARKARASARSCRLSSPSLPSFAPNALTASRLR